MALPCDVVAASAASPLGLCAAKFFEMMVIEDRDGILSARLKPNASCPDCPITGEPMCKPVMTCDGHVYEEEAIRRWFAQGRLTSPLTNLALSNTTLQPLQEFAEAVDTLLAQRPEVQTLMTQAVRDLPGVRKELEKLQSSHSVDARPSKRLRIVLQSAQHIPTPESENALRDGLFRAEAEVSALIDAIGLTHVALGLPPHAWCAKRMRKLRRAAARRAVRECDQPATKPFWCGEHVAVPDESVLTVITTAQEAALSAITTATETCRQGVRSGRLVQLQTAMQGLVEALGAARQVGLAERQLGHAERTRRRTHNMIEDMKGAIRVFCRVRPLSCKERGQGERMVLEAVDTTTVKVLGSHFLLDAVFVPEAGGRATQDDVFEDCRDLIQSAMDGYNVSIFAYGQTGAGKTYTTYGTPSCPGLAPRIATEIFRIVERDAGHLQYTVQGSMLELYRQDLVDLLQDDVRTARRPSIHFSKNGEALFENLEEIECTSADDLWALIQRSHRTRAGRATAMNSESSRSHLIVIVKVSSYNKQTQERFHSKIMLCDLAGSERLSKSQVIGDGAREAIEINKSLTALGDVLESLTKRQKQIPYRNHKLTMLMKELFGRFGEDLDVRDMLPKRVKYSRDFVFLEVGDKSKTNHEACPGSLELMVGSLLVHGA